MASYVRNLYIISFAVFNNSGIAIVVACNENEAKLLLKNSGRYGHGLGQYDIINIKCLGTTEYLGYGLISELYVNALMAFDAFVSVMDKIVGPQGPPGPPGPAGEVTREAVVTALGYIPAHVLIDTTANWNSQIGYIPGKGDIIVYTDKAQTTISGQTVNVPGIKVGSGNAYVQDLAFVADDVIDMIYSHATDVDKHVSAADRTFWNNKLNTTDVVIDETLVLNRN